MKALFNILSNHFKSYFHLKSYISIAFVLIGLISINYYFDVEDDYIDHIHPTWLRFVAMFFFQFLPYIIAVYILYYFKQIKNPFKATKFWILLVVGFSLLGLERSIDFSSLVNEYIVELKFSYTRKVANFLSGLTFIIMPLILFSILTKDKYRVYGLFGRFNGMRPYLFLLLGAFTCVFLGGFFSDIQRYYPIYLQDNPNYFQQITKVSNIESIVYYQISYALSFVSVELFFRGFLLFAFVKYLGKHAILPMAVTYCVLHFGKPMTEAISSIFGGFILGIIAFKHENIRGGILIHVGMAWSMEIIGYLHRIL